MSSIKFKISALVLLCVFLVAAMIGTISMISTKRVVTQYSSELLEERCSRKSEEINALLSRIEQSVVTLSDFALEEITDLTAFQTDAEYVSAYTEKLSQMAINAADNTDGAMTVYIRFNPTFTSPTSGLFASRATAGGPLEKLVPTDFSMYDSNDTAHVGWYYVPVKNKKPTWMAPYLNENLGVNMISYVVPLEIDGTSIGVVGMDIDFTIVQKLVDDVKIYTSGYGYLSDGTENLIYKPESATQLTEAYESVSGDLKNSMKLTITAPYNEIHEEENSLITKIALFSLAGVVVAIVISQVVIYGIIRPLRNLNLAAGQIAEGKLDVDISCNTKDEVRRLADSFERIVVRLRKYILYIDETSDVLQQLARSELDFNLKNDYAGEFAKIKNALMAISVTLNNDMSQIKIASKEIAAGSEQVAQGAQVLSNGTAKQQSSISDMNRLTHTLSKKIESNAEGAKRVDKLACDAGAALQHNDLQMTEMVEAMEIIGENGEKIIQMTKSIEDIAMQTNILALNASIEAARAGAAGKGFSIVAEEVKNLAVKSTGAAEQISVLIQNAVTSIANGTRIAGETKSAVLSTVEDTKAMAQIVKEIVENSDEQSCQIKNLLEIMDKISVVVDQTYSTAQEGAASAEQLSGQSQIMSELVSKFKLRKDNEV